MTCYYCASEDNKPDTYHALVNLYFYEGFDDAGTFFVAEFASNDTFAFKATSTDGILSIMYGFVDDELGLRLFMDIFHDSDNPTAQLSVPVSTIYMYFRAGRPCVVHSNDDEDVMSVISVYHDENQGFYAVVLYYHDAFWTFTADDIDDFPRCRLLN